MKSPSRSDFAKFVRAYHRPKPPKIIWQEAYEFKTAHYRRLMSSEDILPDAEDLHNYGEDLSYIEKIQPDLFAYLLPVYLRAWRHDLMHNGSSDLSGAVFVLTGALARRRHLQNLLKPKQVDAVMAYMRASLLDRIDRETSLSVRPSECLATHYWLYALGDFVVITSNLASLWRDWWAFETQGRAVAALQYLSALMYERNANPIFAPWTPEHGGGPPSLWETSIMIVGDERWQAENVAFFQETVTVNYVRDALERAAETLDGIMDSTVPALMLADYDSQRPLLEHRLSALPKMLSQPLYDIDEWPPMP